MGLGEGGAERGRAGGDADEIEEVAVLAGAGVSPLPGDAGGREADEEGAPPRAANVAGGPVSALLAALGQVAAADFLGACAEGCGDSGGRAHGAHLGREQEPAKPGRVSGDGAHGRPRRRLRGTRPGPGPLGLSPEPGRRAAREAPARPFCRQRLG